MVIFHGYVNVYRRVNNGNGILTGCLSSKSSVPDFTNHSLGMLSNMDWCYFPSSHRLEPKWLLEISPVFWTIHPPLDWSNIPTLVGGAMCPSWKMMEFVNGKDDIPYMKWKIKFMIETTNSLHLIGLFFKHVGFKNCSNPGYPGQVSPPADPGLSP